MRIEKWAVVGTHNPYTAPEMRRVSLSGYVYGHPLHSEGQFVTTSPINSIEEGIVTTVSGSRYELGEVEPTYEALFPNARERLMRLI